MDHLLSKEYLIARLKHLGHFARAFFVHYLLFGFEGLDVRRESSSYELLFFYPNGYKPCFVAVAALTLEMLITEAANDDRISGELDESPQLARRT